MSSSFGPGTGPLIFTILVANEGNSNPNWYRMTLTQDGVHPFPDNWVLMITDQSAGITAGPCDSSPFHNLALASQPNHAASSSSSSKCHWKLILGVILALLLVIGIVWCAVHLYRKKALEAK